MTTLTPALDLDDSDALAKADVEGWLRSAALAGAQARATMSSYEDVVGDRLSDLRPRSVVFVAGGGRARRATAMVVAAVGARIGVPLVVSDGTPPWVGPLDVVVICGDDAGDPRLSEATAAAVRRGAETVLVTPDEGPLRSAAAGRALFLAPRVSVREPNALMRYVAAAVCVLGALSSGAYRALLPDLARLADALDEEASRNHPRHEIFHNPAKSIASRISGRRAVFTGVSALAVETARHGGEVLFRVAGVVAASGDLPDVVAAGVQAAGASSEMPADYDPFFHDDQLDGPRPQPGVRVFVAAAPTGALDADRRTAALDDVEILVAGGDDAASEPVPAVGPVSDRSSARDPLLSEMVGEFESMTLLATRLEMAAAYLHLMGGD
ncbi:tobH protein [Rhodococcus sp. 14-2470-1b]|uniref:tobH protein n=1 Tax=Rhodococcus sp. 14-2470-1b TaxID=2023149 RepID=UPI000B9B3493|nr:tobH protein [Rhodococcus sp. 14-2470-1b]OZF58691.1 tobH protein [Rhodococcus sp. 14-2470-1b]